MDSKRLELHGSELHGSDRHVTLFPLAWMVLYLNISLSKYGVILSHNSINTFMVDTVLTYIPLSYMDNESHSICFILL